MFRQADRVVVSSYICDYNAYITENDIKSLETETQEEQQVVYSAVEAFREQGRVEGLERGLKKGREEGCEEGRKEVREEVAANMLDKGMVPEDVVEVTKLSRDQVETLRQKINGASGD